MAGQGGGNYRKLIRDAALQIVRERVEDTVRQHNIAVSTLPQGEEEQMKEHQRRLDVFQYRHQQVQTSMVDEGSDLKQETLRMSREADRFLAGLPMYSYQTQIIDMVHHSQVSILIGDTGSGKSTQVCQYLYEHGFSASGGMIVCTQPRKVAATSLAERVSSEMKMTLGKLVGYQVGMKKNVTKHTRIVYSTDHCLLNECLQDSLFTKYSVLVVDEAHERSIYTDLLLGLIKKCLPRRPDLKVIITSATIDPTLFQTYFGNCPVLSVPGRMYPVELAYALSSFPTVHEYCQSVMDKVRDVHRTEEPGDILAFLVTPLDCEKCCELLELDDALCMPLHGQLSADKYKEVMAPLTDGKRKIVFATNCAETSITIPGIRYVVDSGFAKEKQFDPRANISKLVICPVSKSSAVQRMGRAGRVESGKCFRMYGEDEFRAMADIAVPEILQVNLGQAVLQLLAFGIIDPVGFDFVQSPSRDSIQKAYNLLDSLGAIDVDGRLSDLGKQMVHLPVDPKHAKFILMCCQDNVGYVGIITATMCMQGNQVFYRGSTDEEKIEADAKKARFLDPKGDVATLLKLFKEWKSQGDHLRGAWCFENLINSKLMKNAFSVAQEIHNCLNRELGITVHRDITIEQSDIVQQYYLTCFFPDHIAFFSGNDRVGYFVPQIQEYCPIHPSSTLRYCGVTPKVVIFENILETSRKYLITVSEVDEVHHQYGGNRWISKEYGKQLVVQHRISSSGPAVQRQLYFSRHQVRQRLKDVFQELNLAPDVQWSPPKTTPQWVDVLVRQDQYAVVNQYLQEAYVRPIVDELRVKRKELSVSEKSDVKVFLGCGAEVVCCMMPHEYTSVKVQLNRACDRSQLCADNLEKFLSQCGKVTGVKQIDQQDTFWGYANFDQPSSAELAVKSDFELFHCLPSSNINRSRGGEGDGFQGSLCVEWLRRPSKEHAFVILPPTVLDEQGFSAESFIIGGSETRATRNQKDPKNLFLRPVPKDCTKQMILNDGPNFLKSLKSFDAIIPSEPASNSLEDDQTAISSLLDPILAKAFFPVGSLKFIGHQETARFVRCFINPTSVTSCLTLLDLFEREVLTYQCRRVKVTAQLKYVFYVPTLVYDYLKTAIDEICSMFSVETRFQPDRNSQKMGRVLCTTNDHNKLKKLQLALSEVLSGSVIDCVGTFSRTLLTRKYDGVLKTIMEQTETLIEKDLRQYRLLIYGHGESMMRAKTSINIFIESLACQYSFESVIRLRGTNKPNGLVKLLLRRFRVDLKEMQDIAGCSSVRLDLRNHEILYVGTPDGFKAVEREVDKLASQVSAEHSVHIQTECPICLGEVEQSVQLSICGHHYCKECFDNYKQNAIQSKQFPLQCYAENCSERLCIDDVELTPKLVASAVERFVATHEDFKFCSTPDCANVYRSTKTVRTYYCSLCMKATCTCCHKSAHSGDDVCSADPDSNDLLTWMAKDPKNRHKCPNCGQGIEKTGGCLHMNCIKCNAHFCWNCQKVYPSASEVYSHVCSAN